LKTKELWAPIVSVLGFFDSLNKGVQLTAYGLRCAATSGSSYRPALGVRIMKVANSLVDFGLLQTTSW
jgi:hypothetical protein